MSNFIIPPDEFFASVGEPGGNYANSFEEWENRAKAQQAAYLEQYRRVHQYSPPPMETQATFGGEWKGLSQKEIELAVERLKKADGAERYDKNASIELQKCPRCKCFHEGECQEERESRMLEGGSDV